MNAGSNRLDIIGGFKKGFVDNHGLDNFYDISQAAPPQFTREDIAKMDPKTFEQNWNTIQNQMQSTGIPSKQDSLKDYSNYTNPELGNSGKIFTREEIGKMSTDEFNQNEKAINHQMKTIGVPSNKQLQNGKSNSGSGQKSGSGSSGDGNWVTINGNHVFLRN